MKKTTPDRPLRYKADPQAVLDALASVRPGHHVRITPPEAGHSTFGVTLWEEPPEGGWTDWRAARVGMKFEDSPVASVGGATVDDTWRLAADMVRSRAGDDTPVPAASGLAAEVDRLRAALGAVLDASDYMASNCRPNEMVGAVLPAAVIARAREALKRR